MSKVARGLRTIGNNIANAAKSAGKLEFAVGEATETIELFDEATGDLKSTYQVFGEISENWDKMSNAQKQSLAITLAGKNQFEVFTAVLGNFADAQESVRLAEESAGSAAKENARYMESLAAKVNALKATFQEIVLGDGGISQFIGKMLDLADSVLKFLNTIDVGKLAEFAAIFGAGGLLLKGVISLTTKFAALSAEAGAFAGIMGLIGGGAVPIVAIAAALGVAVGIFSNLNDEARKNTEELTKARDTLDETKSKISELQAEYDTLYSNKENLNDLEEKRLGWLEEQLKILKEQAKVQSKDLAKATEGTFQYERTTTKIQGSTSGAVGIIETKETITGLEAVQSALNDTREALDNYSKGYNESEQSISEYNVTLKEQVDQFDGVIDGYYQVIIAGGELSVAQRAVVDGVLESKKQMSELSGVSYDLSEAELYFATQSELAGDASRQLSSGLESAILKFMGVKSGSEDAEAAIALYKLQVIAANKETLSDALLNDADAFYQLAEAAGVAMASVQAYQNLQNLVQTAQEHGKAPSTSAMNALLSGVQSDLLTSIQSRRSTLGKTSVGGGGGGGDTTGKKERKDSKKSDLDEFIEVQRKKYVKGAILAETFYKRVQEKAKEYLKKEEITQKEYSDALKKSYDGIFDHVKEQYDRGDISAKKYANNLKKYAEQAYKKNIIDFDKYTDYLIKGYDAQFDELDKKYERGLITGEKYYNEITKLAKEANKKGYLSADDKWKKENKAAKAYLDYLGDNYDKQLISAEKYYNDLLKKAKTYYKNAKITAEEYYKYIEKATQAVVDQTDLEMEAYKMYVDDRKRYADEQIDALKKQKEAQKKANDETERALKLAELQEALAKAKTKQVRVYKEGEGFVYQQDAEAVSKAQKDLNEYNLEQQQKASEDSIDASIDYWEEYKDKWDKGLDDLERTLDKKKWALKSGMEYEDWVNKKGLENYKDFSKEYLKQLEIFTTGYTAQINAQISALQALQAAEAEAQAAISAAKTTTTKTTTSSSSKTSTSSSSSKTSTSKTTTKKAGGSTSMPFSSFVNVNEQGDELFIPSDVNRGDMAYIGKGTGIVPHSMTQNLMEIGKFNLAGLKNFIGGGAQGGTNNVFNFDSIVLPNVSNANDFVSELKNFKNMAIQSSYAR